MLRRLQQGCFLPWPRHILVKMQLMIPATQLFRFGYIFLSVFTRYSGRREKFPDLRLRQRAALTVLLEIDQLPV